MLAQHQQGNAASHHSKDDDVRQGIEEDTKVRLERPVIGEVNRLLSCTDCYSCSTILFVYFTVCTNLPAGIVLLTRIIFLYNFVLTTWQILEDNRSSVFQSKLAITLPYSPCVISSLNVRFRDVRRCAISFGNCKGKGFVGVAKFASNGFGDGQVGRSRYILCVESCIRRNGAIYKIRFSGAIFIRIPTFKGINCTICCYFLSGHTASV